MTKKEAIGNTIEKLETVYDNAGTLRDVSFSAEETECWNRIRTLMREGSKILRVLRLELSIEQANCILKSDHY
jgi:hypothetical protein